LVLNLHVERDMDKNINDIIMLNDSTKI